MKQIQTQTNQNGCRLRSIRTDADSDQSEQLQTQINQNRCRLRLVGFSSSPILATRLSTLADGPARFWALLTSSSSPPGLPAVGLHNPTNPQAHCHDFSRLGLGFQDLPRRRRRQARAVPTAAAPTTDPDSANTQTKLNQTQQHNTHPTSLVTETRRATVEQGGANQTKDVPRVLGAESD
ncbi:hypothetical protein GQ457_15G007450 [Hibiscus cannabinus]